MVQPHPCKIATRKYDVAIRRAEVAEAKSEKLRVRADNTQLVADRAREEADAAAAFTESLFAKARELVSGKEKAKVTATPSRVQQPDVARSEVPLAN
jgi:hypothetical protein